MSRLFPVTRWAAPVPDITVPAEIVQLALALAVIDFARDPDCGRCSIAAWLTMTDRIREIEQLMRVAP